MVGCLHGLSINNFWKYDEQADKTTYYTMNVYQKCIDQRQKFFIYLMIYFVSFKCAFIASKSDVDK